MKELTVNEVLQIGGGLPDQAALDELSYGIPQPAITAATASGMEPASSSDEQIRQFSMRGDKT